MGLFDKKFCDFCGNKIGMLGNRKLEDANMCKDCAAKLSPWFSERRHSTKSDIEAQLAYREQNKSAVAAFRATKTYGKRTKLMIDENNRKFMVTSASDIMTANPDVLDFSQAMNCELDIRENRHEEFRTDSQGKRVSYNPPRYNYSYDMHVTIQVQHPYFDEIKFALSNGSINVGNQQMNPMGMGMGGGWNVSHSSNNILKDRQINEYYECLEEGNQIKAAIDAMRMGTPIGAMGGMGMNPNMGGVNSNDPALMAARMQQAQIEAMKAAARPNNMGAAGMGAAGMAGMGAGMAAGMGMQVIQGMQQPGMGMNPNMGMGMQPGMGMPQQGMQPGMGMNPGMQQNMGMNPNMGMQGMNPNMGMGMQPGMGMPQQGMQQPGMGMPQQGMQQPGMGMPQQGMQNMGQPARPAVTPGMTVTCPVCQATTPVDESLCCQFCGNRLS